MNILKKKLIKHLKSKGKTDTWVSLYNKFPWKGNINNKKKSDSVRGLYRRLQRNISPSPTTTITNHIPKQARILIFDLETSPLLAYVWRCWKQNIYPTNGQLMSEYIILCWSAKWLFSPEVMSNKLTKKEVLAGDDSRIVKNLWALLDEADAVIAHYGNGFDIPMTNARFLKYRLPNPSPYHSIDTKYHSAKRFKLPSNKLDYLAQFLGIECKMDTDFGLWARVMRGEKEAMDYMSTYCDKDITILEAVYLEMRSWIKPHFNIGLYTGEKCCATCGSDSLKYAGEYRTSVNIYDSYRCNDCGSISRGRKGEISRKKFPNLLTSSAK